MMDQALANPIRLLSILPIMLLALIMGGCAPFRLHDAGRLEIAKKAVEATKQITDEGPFYAMEANLLIADMAYNQVADMEAQLRQDTLRDALSSMTRAEIAQELIGALNLHREIDQRLKTWTQQAALTVALEIENKIIVSEMSSEMKQGNLQMTLEEVNRRLRGAKKTLMRINNLLARGDRKQLPKASEMKPAENDADAKKLLEKVKSVLQYPQSDERVQKTTALELEVARAAVRYRQAQMHEMQRHLSALEVIRQDFTERDAAFIRRLMWLALIQVADPQDLEEAFPNLDADQKTIMLAGNESALRLWGEDENATLLEYTRASLNAGEHPGWRAARLTTNLGVILLTEIPVDQHADIEAATELHRHSIRVSRINTEHRLELVYQLAQVLRVYFEGGIRAEEIAKLAFSTAQAAAVIDIAADN